MNKRRSIYFSEKYDRDLIEYVKREEGDKNFSQVAKDLMKDGIKYRQGNSMLQSNTPNKKPNFDNIKIDKKELSKEELEDRLDSF